jgi:hypothetical protein
MVGYVELDILAFVKGCSGVARRHQDLTDARRLVELVADCMICAVINPENEID